MDSPLIDERKSSVLDAAERLLAKEGVDVTMDELAAAAGVGRRTLFRYFDSREELIAAAVERQYDRIVDTIFEHVDAGT
ncbi:MAG: helix-turn-helix transcriptional regulator, partial [Acidimicrobiia bacterium]|nr:helix-turn-helix transcriptional regulator [Acidimicrobiia bacterium]